jgi:RNA polymerase sigma-70 factor (ECF subfamily)
VTDLRDRRAFATTHWSLVVAATRGETSPARARRALADLCRAYWYPLYAFVRSRGHSPDDAQDLTQAFFARVIETGGLAAADPERGRFRSYLLGAMKHFLANEWHQARARKRGGDVTIIELDAVDAEGRFALEPTHQPDPDARFDREWAREVTARALAALRVEHEARDRATLFDALKGSLTGDEAPRRETAAQLGMTAGALKVAIHRLRARYRKLLRAEIAETVSDPEEIDSEMRHLVEALRSP